VLTTRTIVFPEQGLFYPTRRRFSRTKYHHESILLNISIALELFIIKIKGHRSTGYVPDILTSLQKIPETGPACLITPAGQRQAVIAWQNLAFQSQSRTWKK